MWESPIKTYEEVINDITEQKENHIMATIRQYVDVDKDELIKALSYDRDQYEKGFQDGYLQGKAELIEVLERLNGMIEEYRNVGNT